MTFVEKYQVHGRRKVFEMKNFRNENFMNESVKELSSVANYWERKSAQKRMQKNLGQRLRDL